MTNQTQSRGFGGVSLRDYIQSVSHDLGKKGEQFCSVIEKTACQRQASERCSELQAYMNLDPLLATLHRRYQESKRTRKELEFLRGRPDPMVEVARDVERAAWIAVQSRRQELRNRPYFRKKVLVLMRIQRDLLLRKKEEKELEEKLKDVQKQPLSYLFAGLSSGEEKDCVTIAFDFFTLFVFIKLQNAFSLASTPREAFLSA